MKTRINITIEESVLQKIKAYTIKKQTSLSQLIENYLKELVKTNSSKKSILEMVEELPKSKIAEDIDLKTTYYEDKKMKYGN